MPYCTIDDIKAQVQEKILVQLSNDDIGGDIDLVQINPDIVNQCILTADSYIDSKLRIRYELPLNPVPDEIKSISVTLTKYHLYKRRFQTRVPQGIQDEFKSADKRLDEIVKGSMALGVQSSKEAPRMTIRCNKTVSDRMFNKNFFKGF